VLPEPATSPFTPSEEAQLFEACLVHGLSRDHLAAAINDPRLSSLDILAWFNHPQTQQTLAAFRRAQTLAEDLRTAQARFAAITTLEHVCTHDPNLTNRRLAATRLLTPTSPKRLRGFPSDSPSQREGAGGWVREPRDDQSFNSQTDPSRNPEPLPEGGVGVGSRDSSHPEPGGHATNLTGAVSEAGPRHTPTPTQSPQPTQSVIDHPAFPNPHNIAADHPPSTAEPLEHPSTKPHAHATHSATATLTRHVEPHASTHPAVEQINSSEDG